MEYKLPALYALDSIVKNHLTPYRDLFATNLVSSFAAVFSANEDVKIRSSLYKVRTTWNEIFSGKTLHQLDLKITTYDPKWPVPGNKTQAASSGKIHINPAVFGSKVKVKVCVCSFVFVFVICSFSCL